MNYWPRLDDVHKWSASVNIPIDSIISFHAGGWNTMLGEYNSVSSRLKELCADITISKCIYHSIHICAKNTSKVLSDVICYICT